MKYDFDTFVNKFLIIQERVQGNIEVLIENQKITIPINSIVYIETSKHFCYLHSSNHEYKIGTSNRLFWEFENYNAAIEIISKDKIIENIAKDGCLAALSNENRKAYREIFNTKYPVNDIYNSNNEKLIILD